MGTTTTNVGRMGLPHPDFGYDPGVGLHAALANIYTLLGDHVNSRYFKQLSLANGGSVTFEHGFGCVFSEIKFYLYTISGGNLTRVNPTTNYVIEADISFPNTKIKVTNNTGSSKDIVLVVVQGFGTEVLSELDDTDFATPPEDGQALVYDLATAKWKPGASGDSSFKIQSISDPNAVIKGGYLLLPDGRELASYDGSGSLSTDFGKDLTVSLDTILGSDPANATVYGLYIDLNTLGDPTTCTDNGRVLYPITISNFVLKTSLPTAVNLQRYIPRGLIKSATTGTVWSGSGSGFSTLASLRHDPLGSFFSYVEKKLDTATSATTKTVTHGLTGRPQIMLLEFWDNSAAKFTPLNPETYCTDNNATTSVFDFSSLIFDTSDYVQITLGYIPTVSNGFVSSATRYESPWFTDTATTSVTHGLGDRFAISSLSLIEYDVTNDKSIIRPASDLVTYWNGTTIYFDWTGLSPSSTLKYKLITGGIALPQATSPYPGQMYEFTATGQLTGSTTSYPCTKMIGDIPYAIECVQKTSNGWQPVDLNGLAYVTADANKYLRGDIDTLTPSATYPVRITVR